MNNNQCPCMSQAAPAGFQKSIFTELHPCNISPLPDNPVPTMAYVPMQNDLTTYDEMKALRAGTLFPVLDKPFRGSGSR